MQMGELWMTIVWWMRNMMGMIVIENDVSITPSTTITEVVERSEDSVLAGFSNSLIVSHIYTLFSLSNMPIKDSNGFCFAFCT